MESRIYVNRQSGGLVVKHADGSERLVPCVTDGVTDNSAAWQTVIDIATQEDDRG